jgi:hypothetical protein
LSLAASVSRFLPKPNLPLTCRLLDGSHFKANVPAREDDIDQSVESAPPKTAAFISRRQVLCTLNSDRTWLGATGYQGAT